MKWIIIQTRPCMKLIRKKDALGSEVLTQNWSFLIFSHSILHKIVKIRLLVNILCLGFPKSYVNIEGKQCNFWMDHVLSTSKTIQAPWLCMTLNKSEDKNYYLNIPELLWFKAVLNKSKFSHSSIHKVLCAICQ